MNYNYIKTHPIIHRLFLFILFIMLSAIIYLLVGILTSRRLSVSRYTITAPIVNPIRIVQLADLHDKEFGPDNIDLVNLVKEQKPDMIVMTGDMVDWDNPRNDTFISLVRQLKDTAEIYCSLGDHEYYQVRTYARNFETPIELAGGTLLNTLFIQSNINDNQLSIGGCPFRYRDGSSISNDPNILTLVDNWCTGFEKTEGYRILLDHSPSTFILKNGLNEYPVNLIFSGDYHGGIIRIPLIDRAVYVPQLGFFPPYTKGVVEGKYGTVVISAGLGDTRHIPRVYNPPEIVVVDLIPQ